MVQAVHAAGFGTHRVDFHLVSEPEAAAAYCLKKIQPNDLKRGDTFIICDAGGGICPWYRCGVRELLPNWTYADTYVTIGGFCGSVYVDSRFEEALHSRGTRFQCGRQYEGLPFTLELPRSLHEMFRTWEEKVKCRFGGNTNFEGWEVNVPGIPDSPEKNIEDGFHTIEQHKYLVVTNSCKSEDVKKIFDPIVDQVVELVENQFRAIKKREEMLRYGFALRISALFRPLTDRKAILLVGGFGSSEYLRKRLMEGNYDGRVLPVLQPDNSRTAIARGALLRGLDGSIVVERRARRYYGCSSNGDDFTGEDVEAHMHRFWCSRQQKFRIHDRLRWHISKGQVIGSTVSTSLKFFRLVPVTAQPQDFIFRSPLLVCDDDIAPDYLWRRPDAVHELCTLSSDLSSVPRSEFEIQSTPTGAYYRVSYNLVMKVQDETLTFELRIDGTETSYGSVNQLFE
ncbi:hypothetical protein K440DRAFT_583997 [Wilcoxina mikolae CBS 423.85]|nr:hypothetical protein K440DRAFT_583997 [Wilcoxina mikolae CBS 423.85]